MKKVLFLTLMSLLTTIAFGQKSFNNNDLYRLSTQKNTIYLKGDYGKVKRNESYIITFHLMKNANYIIKYEGDNVTFKFNDVSYFSISGK